MGRVSGYNNGLNQAADEARAVRLQNKADKAERKRSRKVEKTERKHARKLAPDRRKAAKTLSEAAEAVRAHLGHDSMSLSSFALNEAVLPSRDVTSKSSRNAFTRWLCAFLRID